MPPIIAIPPAYEGTGYRRFIGDDGTLYPGRVAIELPDSMAIVDEPATATRPARSRLLFTDVPGGAVANVTGSAPIAVTEPSPGTFNVAIDKDIVVVGTYLFPGESVAGDPTAEAVRIGIVPCTLTG